MLYIDGQRLKAIRESRGLTMLELSKRLYEVGRFISAKQIFLMEKRKHKITIRDYLALLEILEISEHELILYHQ